MSNRDPRKRLGGQPDRRPAADPRLAVIKPYEASRPNDQVFLMIILCCIFTVFFFDVVFVSEVFVTHYKRCMELFFFA